MFGIVRTESSSFEFFEDFKMWMRLSRSGMVMSTEWLIRIGATDQNSPMLGGRCHSHIILAVYVRRATFEGAQLSMGSRRRPFDPLKVIIKLNFENAVRFSKKIASWFPFVTDFLRLSRDGVSNKYLQATSDENIYRSGRCARTKILPMYSEYKYVIFQIFFNQSVFKWN